MEVLLEVEVGVDSEVDAVAILDVGWDKAVAVAVAVDGTKAAFAVHILVD